MSSRRSPVGLLLAVSLVGAALTVAAVRPAGAAVDPTLKQIVGFVAIALGEPGLNQALDLIDCVKTHGAQQCAVAQAKSEGQAAANQLAADDPLVLSTVAIVKAAYAKDWLKVVELAGVTALVDIGCKVFAASLGPFKAFICDHASQFAKPVVKTVLVAIKDPSPGHLLEAVTVLASPELACSVVPSFPGKDAICGPLGKVLEFAKDVGEEAAKAGKEAGEFLLDTGEAIVNGGLGALESACKVVTLCDDNGGKKYLSASGYYKYVLFPKIHDMVERMMYYTMSSVSDLYTLQLKYECLAYYPYHQLKNNPQFQGLAAVFLDRCEKLTQRLRGEASVLAKAMQAAPAAYVEASVQPQIPYSVIESYDYGAGKIAEFVKFFSAACQTEMRSLFPIPKPTKTSQTGWDWICTDVGKRAESGYKQEQGKLGFTLASLKKAGCASSPGAGSQGIKLQCASYGAYQQCLTALSAGDEQKHCKVDQQVADQDLAKAIAASLGAKRCSASGVEVACTRPWKVDGCQSQVAKQTKATGAGVGTKCKPNLFAFAVLVAKAENIVKTLNPSTPGSAAGDTLALCDNAGWDALAISCRDAGWPTKAGVQLPACPMKDPNKDGADEPCFAGPLSFKTAQEAIAGSGFKATPGGPIAPGAPDDPTRRIDARSQLPTGSPGASRLGGPPTMTGPIVPFGGPGSTGAGPGGPGNSRMVMPGGPPGGGPGSSRVAALKPGAPMGPPDIVLVPQVGIGGASGRWGTTLTVDARQASTLSRSGAGLCDFRVAHRVKNGGLAAASGFAGVWRNGAVPGSWAQSYPSLGPGVESAQLETVLPLRPGQNALSLQLDTRGQVGEANEANNTAQLTVVVTGSCAPPSGPTLTTPQTPIVPKGSTGEPSTPSRLGRPVR